MIEHKQVRNCFKVWHDTARLGASPLATLPCVTEHVRANGYGDSVAGRGLALRDLLRQIVATLRSHVDPLSKKNRAYVILTDQFINRYSPQYVAAQLYISKRTYHREQAQAFDLVSDALRRRNARIAPRGDVPFLAPPRINRPFIGRSNLLHQLWGQLLAGDTARIALYGLPGVGKTSVLIELAHTLQQHNTFPDGVLWVSLGRQPDLLTALERWARALNANELQISTANTIATRAKMVHSLCGSRKLLLCIDDAWMLDDALALQLGGVNCVQLLTTRFPDIACDFAGTQVVPIDSFAESESVTLLAAISDDSAPADQLALLSHKVGGLPLALSLIGRYLRRTGAGGVELLLESAETRLQLNRPRSPLRQTSDLPFGTPQSLYTSIELSAALLPHAARQALTNLTLLPPQPNVFSYALGIALASGESASFDALAEMGLVMAAGDAQWTLHQTIHDYASQTGSSGAAVNQLVDYFAEWVISADDAALESAFPNIVATLHHAVQHAKIAPFFTIIRAVSNFAVTRGRQHTLVAPLEAAHRLQPERAAYWLGKFALEAGALTDAVTWLTQAVQDIHSQWAGDAAYAMSQAQFQLGQIESAIAWGMQALDRYRHDEEAHEIVNATTHLCLIMGQQGRYAEAETLLKQAVTLAQEAGEQSAEIYARHALGNLYWRMGNYADTRPILRNVVDLCRTSGDLRQECKAILNLVSVLEKDRFFADAPPLYDRALELARMTGERATEIFLLSNYGMTVGKLGQFVRAFDFLREGNELAMAINHRRGEASTLIHIARTHYFAGQHHAGIVVARNALTIAESIQEQYYSNEIILLLAHLERATRQFEPARIHYQQAVAGLSDSASVALQLEARCGLALVQLEMGESAENTVHLIAEVQQLPVGKLQPRTYLMAQQLCALTNDVRQSAIQNLGIAALNLCIGHVTDKKIRRAFFENVWLYRAILA